MARAATRQDGTAPAAGEHEAPPPARERAVACAILGLLCTALVGAAWLVDSSLREAARNPAITRLTSRGFGHGAFGCGGAAPLGVRVENRSDGYLVGNVVSLRAGHPEQWYRPAGRLELPTIRPGETLVQCFAAPTLPDGIRADGARWSGGFGGRLLPGWFGRFLGL